MCLLFSSDAQILYFTTSLTTSVQAYHIQTASLLPPLAAHPSPPIALAISGDGRILVSASSKPPTTYVQDTKSRDRIQLHLESDVSVSCAAFQHGQIDDESRFVLGLKDGKVTVYRLAKPSPWATPLGASPPRHDLHPATVGVPTRLHSAAMGGVCAVELLSGYPARAVSIGFDSRCRLTDFDTAVGTKILRTWSVDGQATCLAISEAQTSSEGPAPRLIAIGTKEGVVEVYNLLGLPVHVIKVTEPIVSVQWVGDMGLGAENQGEQATEDVDGGTVLRVAPALEHKSTPLPLVIGGDLFFTPPTRLSSLRIPRRSTQRRPRIRPSTFNPPGSFPPSTPTSGSLQLADPIPIEDGPRTGTLFFTPESTQRIHSITSELDRSSTLEMTPTAQGRDVNASGSVYSPPTRLSSLSKPQTPTRKSKEKRSVDVARKRIGVHIRQQTETPEWLTPRPVPVADSPLISRRTRSPPPIPPASSSVSALSTPRAEAGRQEVMEQNPRGSSSRINTTSRGGDTTRDDDDATRLLGLRKDHEELKAEVGMLRREVSEIKALLSPQSHPQAHLQVE